MRAIVIAPLPFLFRIVIDEHVKSANLMGILSIALLFSGLLILHYCFAIYAARYFAISVGRMMVELRGRIFHKLQVLSFGYLDDQQTGRLISKYAFDTQRIEGVTYPVLRQLLPEALVSVCIIVLLTMFNWQLMFALALIVPVYAIAKIVFYGKLIKTEKENRLAREGMTGQASELISAIRLIRGFGEEQTAREAMNATSEEYGRSRAELSSFNALFGAFSYVSTQLLSLIIVTGGAIYVIQGTITFGTLVAFLVALPVILSPIQLFISFSQQYFQGRESYRSIKELIDSQYVEEWNGTSKLGDLKGSIKFENVTFAYDEGHLPAVNDINLEIKAGQHVAFVGPSGSGKSTLANMVLGLYKPSQGIIRIDDVPQSSLDMRWFRRNSAIVMQESLLLSGSIKDNIRFARPNATDEEISRVAREANVEEFIHRLPEGYMTSAGEAGVHLSGGQRQRISIARALLRNPRVLILDEATSALDYESEHLVQEALERLSKGRTVITIAHRLSTVKKADYIVVLKEGSVVEIGTFEKLSEGNSYFSEMLEASA